MNFFSNKTSLIFSFLVAILTNIIVEISFNTYVQKYVINPSTFILIFVYLYISSYIKYSLNKVIVYAWFYFYLTGIFFLNSSLLVDSKYLNVNNLDADNFYFFSLIFMSTGLLISEKIYAKRDFEIKIAQDSKINKWIKIFLLLFPFIFFISTFLQLGFIPMLIGGSIVESMYNYNYGYVYGYKLFIIISITLAIFLAFHSKKKWIYFVIVAIYCLISLIDGKRAVLLAATIASLVLYGLYYSKIGRVNFKLIYTILFIIGFSYIFLAIQRTGRDNELVNISSIIQKFPFGVEYTDYVYSFNKFTPGTIQGYDFILSSFGSFMNSSILELIGYDKQTLVESGSAYIWMKEYGIDLGIRTGIISELYFDYGYFTLILMFLMGFYFDYINRLLFKERNLLNFLLILTIYSFNVLLIVGQATVYFGTLTLILYLYIIDLVLKKINKPQTS